MELAAMTVTAPLLVGLAHFDTDVEVFFLFARVVWGAFTTDDDDSSIEDAVVEVAECTVVDGLCCVAARLHAATERLATPMISSFFTWS